MKTHISWQDIWLKTVAPDEHHKLERRVAWDGHSVTSFEESLKQQQLERDQEEPYPWRQALGDCRAAIRTSWDIPLIMVAAGDQQPFVDIWWPIRELASARIAEEMSVHAGAMNFDEGIYNQLADSLLARLCTVGEQVLWENFSAGRSHGSRLLAHLGVTGDGSSPPVRDLYGQFIRGHRRDGLSALLAEYPELGRFIGTVFLLWLQGNEQMLGRVCRDRDVLEREFSIPVSYRLCKVQQELSDPHCGGRAVAILTFVATDTDRRLQVVYKPKDMRVDAAYQAIIGQINGCSGLPPLHTLAVHAATGYGYMQHVPHKLCADDVELQRFYRNAGRLTALLHWLGCTDCHHENLIASADQLVLIDTETLLEPDLPDHIRNASSEGAGPAPSHLQTRFHRSVLRSGLLPQWMFVGEDKQPLDISALGILSPVSEEQLVSGWLGINSDGMMPGWVDRMVKAATSLPVGVGATNPFHLHLDAFCEGFQIQSDALIALRESSQAEDAVLSRFAGLPRRMVLRATRVYACIQRQMLEPAALRSPLAQNLKLELLARSFLVAESKPLHWQVLAAERQQMRQLDIPFFTHPIDGDALYLNNRGEEILGFIQSSGLNSALDRLRELDSEEIAFQLSIIRGAVQARRMRVAEDASFASKSSSHLQELLSPPDFSGTEAAGLIARHLSDLAIRDPQGQVEWLGMNLGANGKKFTFGPVGLSLYGGAVGIACLLEHLRDRPESPPWANVLQAAILKPLSEQVAQPANDKRLRWWRDQPLGLSGCGGVILALLQLGHQETVDVLVSDARPRFLEADHQFDLLGGCAGLIGPLLRVKSDAARQLALLAGDRLTKLQREDGGWNSLGTERTMLGFSHGTAGYAAALARLYSVTKEGRFRAAAVAALKFERSRLRNEVGNWPGIDAQGDEPRFMAGWCNGLHGIALGRACLWGTDLWDDACGREIAVAVDAAAASPALRRDHLCCGNLGMMSILQILCSGPWPLDGAVRLRAQELINRIRLGALRRCSDQRIGLRCFGTREGSVVTPGFFTGLSGMGMALLEEQSSKAAVATLMSGGLLPLD